MNKFLKVMLGLLGLTGILIIVFLLIGVIAGPIEYENTVEIDAPVTKTWELFIDTSLTKEWLPGYQKMEMIEGRINEVNGKYNVYIYDHGKEIVMTQTITEFEPERAFGFVLKGDVLESKVNIEFQEVGDKTRLKSHSEVRGHSMFFRSLFALMKGSFRKNDLAVYERFKKMVEGFEMPADKSNIHSGTFQGDEEDPQE